LQIEAVSRLLGARQAGVGSAAGMVMIAVALARTIVTESALGLTDGHREALAIVENMLDQLQPPAPGAPSESGTPALNDHG
jgi:hypothetical protein